MKYFVYFFQLKQQYAIELNEYLMVSKLKDYSCSIEWMRTDFV